MMADEVDVVHEAIEVGAGDDGVGEVPGPRFEGLVAGDDDARLFVAAGDDAVEGIGEQAVEGG